MKMVRMWWATFLRWMGQRTESANPPPAPPTEEAPTEVPPLAEVPPLTDDDEEDDDVDKPRLGWADDANGNKMPLLIGIEHGDGTVTGFVFADAENGFGITKGGIDLRENLKPTGARFTYGA